MRPNHILAVADRLQVGRPDAVACVAEVVKGQSFWDWADELRVRPAMCTDGFVTNGEHTITPNLCSTSVNPAVSKVGTFSARETRFFNSTPESFGGCRESAVSVAVAFPARIMAAAIAFIPSEERASIGHTRFGGDSDLTPTCPSSQRRSVFLPALVVEGAPATTMNAVVASLNGARRSFGVNRAFRSSHSAAYVNVTKSLYASNGVGAKEL